MLFKTDLPSNKRKAFKNALASGKLMQFPGAMNPLTAKLIENKGFDGVYISGAVLSAELGLPDIGLTTLSEVAGRGHQIARVTNLPTIIDIDTGFGEPMSVARTVQHMEDAGICAVHLEDQQNPKRCGHLDNKSIVSVDEMCRKVKTAAESRTDENFIIMARTDAKASEGIDAAIDRAKAYIDAGADMIFPEALWSEKEFEQFRAAVDVPLLANMTEFGKTELLTTKQLENLGYNVVIYPVTTLRIAMGAVDRGLSVIKDQGTQSPLVDDMQTRAELYDLLRYEEYNTYDKDIFNFKLA